MTSICIFGSAARGNLDSHSDKDLLVVSAAKVDGEALAASFSQAGWSAKILTYADIERLAEAGSLFLQHIKREGIVLYDHNKRLGSILTIANRSTVNLPSALSDMNYLLNEFSPTSAWARLCYADISYVLIRNAAINLLAENELILFDYSKIIEILSYEYNLLESERRGLEYLRIYKAKYRRRNLSDVRFLDPALKGASKIFGGKKYSYKKYNGYQRLRNLELSVVELGDPRALDLLENDDPFHSVWQLIKNPCDYPRTESVSERWVEKSSILAKATLARLNSHQ